MRLGALAREFNLKAKEIIALLEEQEGKELSLNYNSKLSDKQIKTLRKLLIPPVKKEETVKPKEVVKPAVEKKVAPPVPVVKEKKASKPKQKSLTKPKKTAKPKETIASDKITDPMDPDFVPPIAKDSEIIKAPKIKLEGPKVVDKIDLPEPPQKEIAEPTPTPKEEVKVTEKPAVAKKNRKAKSNPKTELSWEKQKELSLKKENERLARDKKLQKELKKKHYLENHAAKGPENKPKKVKKMLPSPPQVSKEVDQKEVVLTSAGAEKQAPKGLWAKIKAWFVDQD